MANEVRIKATVSGNAKQEIGGIRDAWAKFQKEGGQGVKAGLTAAAATKGFALLDSAISGTIGLAGDAARAYMEDEASLTRLTTAVRENDSSYRGNMQAIEDVLASRMKLGFSDDEQRESLASLVAVTKDSAKALEIQRTAMDLARLRGMSLADATQLLGKVYGGNLGILSRYGIQLEKGTSATEALAEIQKRAAGQAEAYANTNIGKLEASQIRVNEAMEHFGRSIAPLVAEGAEKGADAIEGLTDVLEAGGNGFAFWADKATTALDVLTFWDEQTHGLAMSNKHLSEEMREQGKTLDDLTPSIEGAGGATDDMGDSMRDAKQEAEDLEAALGDLKDAAYDAVDAFGDQAYSADELKGKLVDAREEVTAAKDEVLKLAAIKNPTKDQQDDLVRAKGKLAEARHETFNLRVDLAKLDGTGLDALLIELSKVQYRTDALGDEAREALSYFQKLAFSAGKVSGYRGDPGYGRASGGPVYPGKTYTVGEKGPEKLVMGSTGGYVIPNSGAGLSMPTWSGASSTPSVININVYPSGVMTPATAQALRDELAPVLSPIFQRKR